MGVFSAYTILAGKVADAYTDAVQAALMAIFVVVLAIGIIVTNGSNGAGLTDASYTPFEGHTPISLLALFVLLGLSYLVGPDVYAAILSADSEQTAKRSAVAGALIIAAWTIFI